MTDLTDVPQAILDKGTDLLEKVSSPGSRAGSSVERVGKMTESGVDPEVIALQMSKNSAKGQTYTTQDVESYNKLYQDAKTRAPITKEQTTGLIKDQQNNTPDIAPQGA